MDKDKSQSPPTESPKESKEKPIAKKLAEGGYHRCKLVELDKEKNGNIAKFGKVVKRIKCMHESNIDEYNTQQINSGRFIKKDDVKYTLESMFAKGRVNADGSPKPYKYFLEVKKDDEKN